VLKIVGGRRIHRGQGFGRDYGRKDKERFSNLFRMPELHLWQLGDDLPGKFAQGADEF
jgi:hypothetical protein